MIVLLNGTSSSGKTSIAQALQRLAPAPFLYMGIDHLARMIPRHYIAVDPLPGDPAQAGFRWASREADGRHWFDVAAGPLGERWIALLRGAVAHVATLGQHVVVDDIVLDDADFDAYAAAFAGVPTLLVGLRCAPDILEAREAGRPERMRGQARAQHERIHRGVGYDLELDSGRLSPEEAARAILDRMTFGDPPRALAERAGGAGPAPAPPHVARPAPTWGLRLSAADARARAQANPVLKPQGARILGDVLWLCQFSPIHYHYPLSMVYAHFLPAILHNQFRVHYANYPGGQTLVGFATWAWLSDELHERFRTGRHLLQPHEWQGGRNLWFPELLAPFGHAWRVTRDLRQMFKGHGPCYALRPRVGSDPTRQEYTVRVYHA